MTYRVVNTTDWTYEQLAPYTKQITAYFKKLVDKFPEDITVEALARDVVVGAKQMWLVFHGDEFVAVALTAIRTVDATGHKIVTVTSLGGNEGAACVPALNEVITEYAKQENADFISVEGRRGWDRALRKHGFKEYAVVWRKPLRQQNG